MKTTTTVNDVGYTELLERVAGLNRRVVAFGCEPFVLSVIDRDKPGLITVEIAGNAPTVPGHRFVGLVEHLSDGGNILKFDVPAVYRDAPPLCQHCFTTRRRFTTYILQHVMSGEYRQISRNCLADYLRDDTTVEALACWAAWVDELLGKLPTTARCFTVRELVELSIAWSRDFGWVSAKQANETGDRSSASNLLSALVVSSPDLPPVDEHTKQHAQHVYDWVAGVLGTLDDDRLSNYEANLVVLFRQQHVTAKHVALVCSAHRAYGGYQKQLETAGTHVGTVGERSEFHVDCVKVVSLGVGEFGERFLCKFKQVDTDNVLVWFTGENLSFEEGERAWIAGGVKEHGDYNGRPQTIVQRVKKLDGPTPVKKSRSKKAAP